MTPLSFTWLLVDLLFCWCTWHGNADKFTLGYLTGASRRPWDKEYSRPGLSISGEMISFLFSPYRIAAFSFCVCCCFLLLYLSVLNDVAIQLYTKKEKELI